MEVTSTLSNFVLQSLAEVGRWGSGEHEAVAPQGLLLAFPSEIHLPLRKITGSPWKIIREEPTSYTYPGFWLSPKCEVAIEPTFIFNLSD